VDFTQGTLVPARVENMQVALMRSVLHSCNFLALDPIGHCACMRIGVCFVGSRIVIS
jgi:hypothetical protein